MSGGISAGCVSIGFTAAMLVLAAAGTASARNAEAIVMLSRAEIQALIWRISHCRAQFAAADAPAGTWRIRLERDGQFLHTHLLRPAPQELWASVRRAVAGCEPY